MRIAYFINQYPKVSHSFIRREILALERQGFEVQRIALRGWDGDLVDAEDLQERTRTRYVLQDGVFKLAFALSRAFLISPRRFLAALRLAMHMGKHADRPWPFHIVYFAEACRILPWLKKFGSSHVHAHFGTNSAEVVMLANALGGPSYSFTVHGADEFDKPEFLHLREKTIRAAFVVAVSSYGRSQLFRWVEHNYWNKLKVVHCGLEKDFYAGASFNSDGLPTSRFVCVGRLCREKGQLLLLQAASRLTELGVEFEIVLAGDGEMRADVENVISRYNLQGKVRITGWISSDQVRDEILGARALVLPSFYEGLPVVIMEAMALRRPVLSTYVAGIPELVRPGENGWLFPAGDVEELVVAMADCLAQPDEVLARMGEAGYRRVLERHDIDIEAGKLAELFAASVGAAR